MKWLFWILFFTPFFCLGQFSDDFSDGDFTINPTWTGDELNFEILGGQLHLNATPVTDVSYLSTPSVSIENAVWEFFVKMDFNPSSSNLSRVYLVSDQVNLSGALNGYFVEIGGTSDEISLYRQDGTDDDEIIDGTDDLVDTDPVEVKVKVTRDMNGNWELLADLAGGTNYISLGTVSDSTYFQSFYCGVYCSYTSTRSDLFYFDGFIVTGNPFVDDILPEVLSVSAISTAEVEVAFSEAVDQTLAEIAGNYTANNGLGSPISAVLDGVNPALVHLTFGTLLNEGTIYTLSVSGIEDLYGNTMISANHDFAYYIAKQFDVVFNEIMPDPSPSVGLPANEFIELYNRAIVPINIKDWQFTYGLTSKLLPDVSIPSQSYLVLTTESAVPSFGSFIDVVAVEGLSSTALTNAGNDLSLRDTSGNLIHAISYSEDWYQDNSKDEGGWSLEQVDPSNPCGAMENWRASVANLGGTPGVQNSVFAANEDTMNPSIERVSVIDSLHILLYFNETVDSTFAADIQNYSVDNNIGIPVLSAPSSPTLTRVSLTLPTALQVGIIYEITISDSIRDCVGNMVSGENTARFAIPERPDAKDVVVNEILSNPRENGADFIELFNRSEKVIDLKDLRISNFDTIAQMTENVKEIAPEGFSFFPGEYLVLTESPIAVMSEYEITNPKGFVEVHDLPSFVNDNDEVVISDTMGEMIDLVIYNEDMHFALLEDLDGVSLERISPNRDSDDETNWHSAAEDVGFATPAYENSQYNIILQEENPISIEPEVFSPDNDGYEDVLNISYEFDQSGFVANVTVYDGRGRLIKYIARNKLLGTSGTMSWDGINEEREKARIGVYVLFFEVFDTSGNVKKYKNSFVLGGRL